MTRRSDSQTGKRVDRTSETNGMADGSRIPRRPCQDDCFGPSLMLCTLESGHPGGHAARTSDGTTWAAWARGHGRTWEDLNDDQRAFILDTWTTAVTDGVTGRA